MDFQSLHRIAFGYHQTPADRRQLDHLIKNPLNSKVKRVTLVRRAIQDMYIVEK